MIFIWIISHRSIRIDHVVSLSRVQAQYIWRSFSSPYFCWNMVLCVMSIFVSVCVLYIHTPFTIKLKGMNHKHISSRNHFDNYHSLNSMENFFLERFKLSQKFREAKWISWATFMTIVRLKVYIWNIRRRSRLKLKFILVLLIWVEFYEMIEWKITMFACLVMMSGKVTSVSHMEVIASLFNSMKGIWIKCETSQK